MQDFKTIYYKEVLNWGIYAIEFSKFEKKCYLADYRSNLKVIRWNENSNQEEDFQLNKESIEVNNDIDTFSIKLTHDENELLVGSNKSLFIVNADTLQTIKRLPLPGYLRNISLIENNDKALLTLGDGKLFTSDIKKRRK